MKQLNKKVFKIIVVLIIAFTTLSWGFYGHKKINKHAVLILPSPLINLYKKNIIYLTEHSVDADKRRYAIENEKYNHYIDVDAYQIPIDSIPKKWKNAVELYTEDTILKHGILPWNILFVKYQLQKAFEEHDFEKIMKLSADLGHYIGDLHVPLHTTKNYNGQLTNQHGIHALWESRMVELYSKDWKLYTGQATYIENPLKVIWESLKASNSLVKQVFEYETLASNITSNKFAFETVNQQVKKVYSNEFCDNYKKLLEKMIENRLKSAINLTSSMWYTCWVDAGQPII
ncbi:MAG: S1/P1 Nuclease, partial [Crocinitomicaceae bacterium]|nr:S1/P1 Nuclease [Crocinitomicaceae bacterium]